MLFRGKPLRIRIDADGVVLVGMVIAIIFGVIVVNL